MSEHPATKDASEYTVIAPRSLLARLRDDVDGVTTSILELPRAADISDDDAHQIVHGLMQVAIEAAEGKSTAVHDLVIEAMRDVIETGRPLADALRGLTRVYLLLSAVVVRGMPEEDRDAASIWFAEFASSFVRDVVKACVGAR